MPRELVLLILYVEACLALLSNTIQDRWWSFDRILSCHDEVHGTYGTRCNICVDVTSVLCDSRLQILADVVFLV